MQYEKLDFKIHVVVNAGNMVDNVISVSRCSCFEQTISSSTCRIQFMFSNPQNANNGSMYKPLADNMRRYGPKSTLSGMC